MLTADGITVAEGNGAVTKYDNVLYSADMKTLLYYSSRDTRTEFVMPDEVENIPESAFASNSYLRSVTLSESLKSIPTRAFYMAMQLQSITIPASVTEIAPEAFLYAFNLSSVTMSEDAVWKQ